jgi:hypothetical protein
VCARRTETVAVYTLRPCCPLGWRPPSTSTPPGSGRAASNDDAAAAVGFPRPGGADAPRRRFRPQPPPPPGAGADPVRATSAGTSGGRGGGLSLVHGYQLSATRSTGVGGRSAALDSRGGRERARGRRDVHHHVRAANGGGGGVNPEPRTLEPATTRTPTFNP